jgi:hypothetical protein
MHRPKEQVWISLGIQHYRPPQFGWGRGPDDLLLTQKLDNLFHALGAYRPRGNAQV